MKRAITIFALLGISTGIALAAADDDIKARQAAMKAVGAAAKAGDFAAMNEAAIAAKAAFAANTAGQGSVETKALDSIWGDGAAGFNTLMDQLISASGAGDKGAFATCKGCHKDYRS